MTDRNKEYELRMQIESDRIKKGLCPKCGCETKDKGSYLRCTTCPWVLTNGSYNEDEGYCIDYSGENSEPLELHRQISAHITLTKLGPSYVANCPFHDDDQTSLDVCKDRKGRWFFACFACDARGTTIEEFLSLLGKYGKLQ